MSAIHRTWAWRQLSLEVLAEARAHQARHDDRCTTIAATLAGETVHITCDDRDHAEWLAGHMRTMGIPAAAITIRREEAR